MKKLVLAFLLVAPICAWAQSVAQKTTFDIVWPDQTVSVIVFTDSIRYQSIQSDSSIEFNAALGTGGTYLKTDYFDKSCYSDTNTFFPATSQLFLGGGENACYQYKVLVDASLLFRNAKNPALKGIITYKYVIGDNCIQYVNNICFHTDGFAIVQFESYQLNTDNVLKYITPKTVLGLDNQNSSTLLNISPNPFSSNIRIESTQYTSFHLAALDGRIIKSNLPTNTPVDLSEIENGVYLVSFGNGTTYKRIIKQ